MININNRMAWFIDGSNMYATGKALRFDIDWDKLMGLSRDPNMWGKQPQLVKAFYYTAVMPDSEPNVVRPLIDWLSDHGYCVRTKPARQFYDASTGERKIKGNMDIEIAVDVMTSLPYVDHVVLFTGDGDFTYLVNEVQRQRPTELRVTVVSTKATNPPMVADTLRKQCDKFIDLRDYREHLFRENIRRVS